LVDARARQLGDCLLRQVPFLGEVVFQALRRGVRQKVVDAADRADWAQADASFQMQTAVPQVRVVLPQAQPGESVHLKELQPAQVPRAFALPELPQARLRELQPPELPAPERQPLGRLALQPLARAQQEQRVLQQRARLQQPEVQRPEAQQRPEPEPQASFERLAQQHPLLPFQLWRCSQLPHPRRLDPESFCGLFLPHRQVSSWSASSSRSLHSPPKGR
jgi:hypothetical protein